MSSLHSKRAQTIASQLAEVRAQVAETTSQETSQRPPASLLAVSKTWPAEDIQAAYDTGQRLFGENRLQEAEQKIPQLPTDCDWHFIGTVQRNKVRKILPLFSTIHAVDSLKLAQAIDRVAGELSLKPKIYLQIHIGNEDSKHGFSLEEFIEALPGLESLTQLEIIGLMCIPPPVENIEDARPHFKELVSIRNKAESLSTLSLPQLSMGMSHDFTVAIQEGSTIVRVGSSIFGKRDYGSSL